MEATRLCYGMPDIDLPRVAGGEINPSTFAGHELVVFFCPADPIAAEREIESFRGRASAFTDAGAWVIGILSAPPSEHHPHAASGAEITLAFDPDGHGRAAFESLLGDKERSEESDGATFLFARGGSLDAAWAGAGHADEVLVALHRPF